MAVAPAHTRFKSAAPTILDDLGDNKLQIKPAIRKPAQSHNRPIGDPCRKPPERRHRHNRSEHEVTQTSRCSPGQAGVFGCRAAWTRKDAQVWQRSGGTLFADPFQGAMSSTRAVLEWASSTPIQLRLPSSHAAVTTRPTPYIYYTSSTPIFDLYPQRVSRLHPLNLNYARRNGALWTAEGRPAQDGAAVS